MIHTYIFYLSHDQCIFCFGIDLAFGFGMDFGGIRIIYTIAWFYLWYRTAKILIYIFGVILKITQN
jgi:hypothetical protein